MADKYKLTYFPMRGRGEIIRYILAQANVPYEEVIIKFQDWQKEKPNQPFGNIPVLEVNGKELCQSTAIARYLANKYGLAGNDPWTKAYADMLVQMIEDMYVATRPYVMASLSRNEAAIAETEKVLFTESVKPLFDNLESILGNKKYFAGDQLTFADLAVAELADRMEKLFTVKYLDSCPNVKSHMIRIHELPNIKKYVEKRPEPFIRA